MCLSRLPTPSRCETETPVYPFTGLLVSLSRSIVISDLTSEVDVLGSQRCRGSCPTYVSPDRSRETCSIPGTLRLGRG